MEKVRNILDSITYKPGIILKVVKHGDFYAVRLHEELAIDTETKDTIDMDGHITYIPVWATKEEVVREIYYLCLRWEMHELQEFFKVDGKRPYNPHHSLEALMNLN